MKNRIACRILRTAAFLLIALQVFAISALAKENVLSIYKNNAEESVPFSVTNMFPGDCETNIYNISVSYNGTISVYFTADVRKGHEKLAEVLKCKVVLNGEDNPLYDGLLKDMPDLEHSISAVNKTVDLIYKISVYLDTSVGNEYQNKQLVADFKWWAYTADEGRPGHTGNNAKPIKPVIPSVSGEHQVITPGGSDATIPPIKEDENKPVASPDGETAMPGMQPEASQQWQEEGQAAPTDAAAVQRPTGQLINPPLTGDAAAPVLWIVLICISILVIFLILLFKKKKSKTKAEQNALIKKLTICIVIIVILAICLCVTTFALVYSIVMVDENVFKTGTVEINLNDSKPIITQDEFLFEPGMTVRKDFFIENEGSDAVYYKIYFDKLSGGLAKVLNVKIFDKETGNMLYSGKAEGLVRENCDSAELMLNETRILTAEFHYPQESGNETQNMSMSFDMCAVATQKKNNTNREFN
ncbi:MAG: hypothetical protein IKW59_02575 [Clostridia bacterium]|nr:hypothetical protein [Clostridia bacterium]